MPRVKRLAPTPATRDRLAGFAITFTPVVCLFFLAAVAAIGLASTPPLPTHPSSYPVSDPTPMNASQPTPPTQVDPSGPVPQEPQPQPDAGRPPAKFAIVIHGGAGSAPQQFAHDYNAERHAALDQALGLGEAILEKGGSSLDAVETVIRFMEDDPMFNAGRGAVFTDAGRFELDASIMLGNNKACGAVASVTTVRHPISLARKVMEQTQHVLLVSEGAETFARSQDLEIVNNDFFWTPQKHALWERWQQRKSPETQTPNPPDSQNDPNRPEKQAAVGQLSQNEVDEKKIDPFSGPDFGAATYRGTVGCVALDQQGNICAGTSSGGLLGKRFGRVGDSPIVGAGTYADNRFAGVSGTGTGEQYIRNAAAYQVIARMRFGNQSLESAIDQVLQEELEPGDGGLIGLDKEGNVIAKQNTPAMGHAFRDGNGKRQVVWDPQQK